MASEKLAMKPTPTGWRLLKMRLPKKNLARSMERTMEHPRSTLFAVALLSALPLAGAQDANEGPVNTTPIGEDFEVDGTIERIETRLQASGDWDRVARAYQTLIDEKDAPYSTDGRKYLSLEKHCHQRISQLPPEGLVRYRDLVDPRAEEEYRKGVEGRDIEALSRIRRHYFCSSVGDEALLLLARILMDGGSFTRAARVLVEIHPLHPDAGLAYPRPDVPESAVFVRLAVCYAELGEEELLKEVISRIDASRVFPNETLAKRFDDHIAARLEGSTPDWNRDPSDGFPVDWPTTYGSPSRTNESGGGKILLDKMNWKVTVSRQADLDGYSTYFNQVVRTGTSQERSMLPATMPIVLGNRAYFKIEESKNCSLVAVDLYNGRLLWKGKAERDPRGGPLLGSNYGQMPYTPNLIMAWRLTSDYSWNTLSCHGGRVYSIENSTPRFFRDYARMTGVPAGSTPVPGNEISAYDASTGKLIVKIDGNSKKSPEFENTHFLSTPTAHHGLLVVPAQDGDDYFLYAFRERDFKFLWRSFICSVVPAAFSPYGYGSTLLFPPEGSVLAIQEGTAYWVSNNGIVAAIDLSTGAKEWLVRYPRVEATLNQMAGWNPTSGWEPSPPILAEGRLIVAPLDSDYLFCLDAASGDEKWRQPRVLESRERREQYLLIGYRAGNIFTAGNGVIARSVADGKVVWTALPVARGRGLLTEDYLYLPGENDNREGIFKINLKGGKLDDFDPLPADASQGLGNLVLAGGVLISASSRDAVAFCSLDLQERNLRTFTREIAEDPDDYEPYWKRGKTYYELASSGQDPEARVKGFADLERAYELVQAAGPSEKIEREKALLRRDLFEKKLEKARETASGPDFEGALALAQNEDEKRWVELARAESFEASNTAEAVRLTLELYHSTPPGTRLRVDEQVEVDLRLHLESKIEELLGKPEAAKGLDSRFAPFESWLASSETESSVAEKLEEEPFVALPSRFRRALAQVHLAGGRFEKAIPYLRSISGTEDHPLPNTDPEVELWALVQLVEGYEAKGSLARAGAYLTEIRDRHSKTSLPHTGGDQEPPKDEERTPERPNEPEEGPRKAQEDGGEPSHSEAEKREEEEKKKPGDRRDPARERPASAAPSTSGRAATDSDPATPSLPEGEGPEPAPSSPKNGEEYFQAKNQGGKYDLYLRIKVERPAEFSAAKRPTEAWHQNEAVLAGSRFLGVVQAPDGQDLFLVQLYKGQGAGSEGQRGKGAGIQCRRVEDGTLVWGSPFLLIDPDPRNASLGTDLHISGLVRLGPAFSQTYRWGDATILCLERGVYAFACKGGKLHWKLEVASPTYESLGFVNAPEIVDTDKATISQRFQMASADRLYFSSVLVGDRLVLALPSGLVQAIDLSGSRAAGKPQVAWSAELGPSLWTGLVAFEDRVALVRRLPPTDEAQHRKSVVLVLDAESGETLQRIELAGMVTGREIGVTSDGFLPLLAGDQMVAIHLPTGAVAWTRSIPHDAKRAELLVLGEGKLALALRPGGIRILDSIRGIELAAVSRTSNDDRLFAGTASGNSVFLVVGRLQVNYPIPQDAEYYGERTYQDLRILKADLSEAPVLEEERPLATTLQSPDWIECRKVEGGILIHAACHSSASNAVWVFGDRLGNPLLSITSAQGETVRYTNAPTRPLLASDTLLFGTGAGIAAWRSLR